MPIKYLYIQIYRWNQNECLLKKCLKFILFKTYFYLINIYKVNYGQTKKNTMVF